MSKIIGLLKGMYRNLLKKLHFVTEQNDQVTKDARAANLHRIYYTAAITAPVHLLIALIFLVTVTPDTSKHILWRKGVIAANLSLFVLELLVGVIAGRMRKRNVTMRQLAVLQYAVITLVMGAGIAITIIDQLAIGNITPFTISSIIVGTFYFVRPKHAVGIYAPSYVLYCYGMGITSYSPDALLSNRVNGLVSVFIGLSLSVVTWRNFCTSSFQKRKIISQQAQLAQMAYHDPLTNLPNRRFLDEVLKRETALVRRRVCESTIIILDIDNFKEVNDTYGHPAGDSVLIQLAELLRDSIRSSDTLARLGGEEFIVLLTNTSLSDGVKVAEKLRLAILEHEFVVPQGTLHLTASFGVSPLLGEEGPFNYYALADQALYRAKAKGKNEVQVVSNEF